MGFSASKKQSMYLEGLFSKSTLLQILGTASMTELAAFKIFFSLYHIFTEGGVVVSTRTTCLLLCFVGLKQQILIKLTVAFRRKTVVDCFVLTNPAV